jgi:hypothetical protein
MTTKWWEVLLWALGLLFYLALLARVLTIVILDVILERFSKAVELWLKAIANKDKVTSIK